MLCRCSLDLGQFLKQYIDRNSLSNWQVAQACMLLTIGEELLTGKLSDSTGKLGKLFWVPLCCLRLCKVENPLSKEHTSPLKPQSVS